MSTRHYNARVREPDTPQFIDYFKRLELEFREAEQDSVQVLIDGEPLGDCLTDNAWKPDGYRYHDVFHFAFALWLGWSPCVRKLLSIKRKEDPRVDEVEDGARAATLEEAVALIVFRYAKDHEFFADQESVPRQLLHLVRYITDELEVKDQSADDWEVAILGGYSVFRKLLAHNGGRVIVDFQSKEMEYVGRAA